MMPSKPKNKLAQLVKAERYIAQFQTLSGIHERMLGEHNDQLDFTWKDGYAIGVRDTNGVYKSKIAEHRNQLLNQAKRHQKRVEELKGEIANTPTFITSESIIGEGIHNGFVVSNWRTGWLWLSNWVFAVIGYIAVFGIPPEVMTLLPVESQTKVIAVLSVIGLIFRFINQSKPKPLPELKGGLDDFAA